MPTPIRRTHRLLQGKFRAAVKAYINLGERIEGYSDKHDWWNLVPSDIRTKINDVNTWFDGKLAERVPG